MAISRRNVLKLTATSTLALQTPPLNAAGVFSKIEKIPHATRLGAFSVKLEDGALKELEPQKSDANPSIMTQALIDATYSDTRIKHPCVRKSYLEGASEHQELRGREEFVRVSWEVALDLVAKKLTQTPSSNIYNASSSKHAGCLHNPSALAGRFFNLALGGVVECSGEHASGASIDVSLEVMGDIESYALQTSHEEIIENCKVYVLWGADLFKNNRMDFNVPNHLNDTYYPRYKKAGIKFISIDPCYTESAEMFDAEWIKIRPNTDVALMLGMMHHLYRTKKYNKTFIARYTSGFDKFLPYLLGKTDKTPKTPEWAEKITQVPSKKIKELAELFVSTRTFLAGNWAMQRAEHGEQVHWALITLASMIGQIGLSGGGFGFAMHYLGGGQADSGQTTPPPISRGENKLARTIPASRLTEALLNPEQSINYRGQTLTYPKIDLVYACGSALVGRECDTNELLTALRTLDTLIVQDAWWNPTAKMADIVLPSTTSLERDDLTSGGYFSRNFIYAMKKAISPLYEAKNDFEIFESLAQRLGGEELKTRFNEGKSSMQWIQSFYQKSSAPNFKDFEQFWRDGAVEFEIPKEALSYVRHAEFRKDPVQNPLATQSGKIQIFSPSFSAWNLPDFKGHPIWIEPSEWLGSKRAKTYPFHLLSPHPRYRLNSQLDNTWIRNLYKIQGREPVMINTQDAKRLNIKQGEIVEVFNDRGALLAGALVSDKVREGVVIIQEGAWYDPEYIKAKRPRCNAGSVNILTSSRPSSQMSQATSANTALVGIKKLPPNEAIKPSHSTLPPIIIG